MEKSVGAIAPIRAAASTTAGKGTAKRNSAAKALTAIAQDGRPLSARLATRKSASKTITSTAHFSPKNTASTAGTSPATTKMIDRTVITRAPGRMNKIPAISPPFGPCSNQPR